MSRRRRTPVLSPSPPPPEACRLALLLVWNHGLAEALLEIIDLLPRNRQDAILVLVPLLHWLTQDLEYHARRPLPELAQLRDLLEQLAERMIDPDAASTRH
jgi:hypothetical protein